MVAAPVLGLKTRSNLLQSDVNVLLWCCNELREGPGDPFFVIDRDNRLKGVRKNEMEQGLPLRRRSVGVTLQQRASEVESRHETLEFPWVID